MFAPCVIADRTQEFYTGISQCCFEEIPVFGVYRLACRDYSLYLLHLVLVHFREVVVVSLLYVAFNLLYPCIVHFG